MAPASVPVRPGTSPWLWAESKAITVVVTARDRMTTSVYTMRVTRRPSPPPVLSRLTLSDGSLAPVFHAFSTDYKAKVANSVTSVRITATARDQCATVAVEGVPRRVPVLAGLAIRPDRGLTQSHQSRRNSS